MGSLEDGPPVLTAPRRLALTLLVWLGLAWVGAGFVSSNDGSHVALARALGVRGEANIDPDVGLTLGVDRARREGHHYSDRPPGTAFLAMPAVWIGHQLDPRLARRSQATGELVVQPGSWPYLQTYAARSPTGPPLYTLQATAVAARVQAGLLGAVGVWLAFALGATWKLGARACWVSAGCLVGATLWGPYATALFSHVTAGVLLAAQILCLRRDRPAGSPWLASLGGLCGGWAVATGYALVFAVVPIALVMAPRGRWAWIAAGAIPIVGATAAYHTAAFGSPLAIGYDHHANFEFARGRLSTFDGNPLRGAWTLWGLGRGAGVLALSPIVLPGLVGVWRLDRRLLLAMSPWLGLLCFHHTPWGGAGMDHRYLIPALPILMLGVGHLWERSSGRVAVRWGLAALAVGSAALTWTHFFSFHR